jgi:AcrR family transcriptional regulator
VPAGAEDLFRDVRPTARRVVYVALEAFAEKGYHATTTREIASKAEMSPAAMYIHYSSKQDLLLQISRLGHEAALDVVRTAADSTNDPVQRLRNVVQDFAMFHVRHRTTARVAQFELRSLTPENFATVAVLRRHTEDVMRATLQAGIGSGDFTVPDPAGAALALLSLGIDIARWFPVGWHRKYDEIGTLYADLALRMVTGRGSQT